jgi:uncharacterized protein YjbI with pentapeptide repeats
MNDIVMLKMFCKKGMPRLRFKELMLIIIVCFVALQASLWDRYLRKIDIAYAAWRQPNQSGSIWTNTVFYSKFPVLYRLNLVNKNFNSAKFVRGGLYKASFENTKFIHAYMTYSHFEHCIFNQCDLRNADLRNADLNGTLFRDTDLRDANLAGADLTNVTFWHVDLRGANLVGAQVGPNWFYRSDLRNANLRWNKTGTVLYDSQTKWPKGFDLNTDTYLLSDTPPTLGGR